MIKDKSINELINYKSLILIRIRELKKDIHKINKSDEYFRIKNYDSMIHNLKLLNQYRLTILEINQILEVRNWRK